MLNPTVYQYLCMREVDNNMTETPWYDQDRLDNERRIAELTALGYRKIPRAFTEILSSRKLYEVIYHGGPTYVSPDGWKELVAWFNTLH